MRTFVRQQLVRERWRLVHTQVNADWLAHHWYERVAGRPLRPANVDFRAAAAAALPVAEARDE